MRKTSYALWVCLTLGAAAPALGESVDAKLLTMLRANGSITQQQYDELSADLAKEQQAQKAAAPAGGVSKEEFDKFSDKVAWAARTVVSGDIRVRQETISVQNEDPERQQDRQRIRARIGIVSQVTDEVTAGARIASGSSPDARSTNQSLDGNFTKKQIWLDRAYVDYHPTAVPGLSLIGGKMAQPWFKVEQVIWDDDTNPEGFAGLYSRKFGGVELFGSTGAFTLQDGVNGNGVLFQDDLRLISGQLGAKFKVADNFNVTLGGSVYHYHLDGDSTVLSANGNTSSQFQLYEGFGQVVIDGLPLPLTVYGQYVKNPSANGPQSDEDKGWLAGFKTKFWNFGFNYNYRNVQRNAVVGFFTDSDFAAGYTGSRGSKFQVSYPITKNFEFATTYFMTQSNAASTQAGSDVDTWQIDVVAKF